jgi:hypothetical protein
VAASNALPSVEGSGDYNDNLVPIKSLTHKCVEPSNISDNSEKNCKPISKPEKMWNKPYRRTASDCLRRGIANKSKEIALSSLGPCYEMDRCYSTGNRIDAGRQK